MQLRNSRDQIHHVYINSNTCTIKINRDKVRGVVTIQFDATMTMVEGVKKIKNVVALEDDMFVMLAEVSKEAEEAIEV